MTLVEKEEVKASNVSFSIIKRARDLMVKYPSITFHDNKEVIQIWIENNKEDIPTRPLDIYKDRKKTIPF